MRYATGLLVCLCLLMMSATSWAQSRFYAAGGAEAWVSPNGGGHGYFILSYQRPKVYQDVLLDVTLNTDTLQITLDNYTLSKTMALGGYLKGQALIAGLLQDYYIQGNNRPERGFNASYLQSAMYLKNSDAPHYLQLEVGGRKWFFSRAGKTSDALILPAESWVLEPRLRYTYWDLKFDPATMEAHRHYWRVDGLAFGFELGLDWRDQRQPWGARDEDSFEVPDLRNDGAQSSILARAWIRAGYALTKKMRVQGMINMATGQNQDDLNRVRAGGMNPYVIPIAGLPWASHLPDTIVSSELAMHYKILSNSEIGAMMHSAVMNNNDLQRTRIDDPDIGGLIGVGLFGDWRFGDWQFDSRFGWALPFNSLSDNPHLTLWLSVGKRVW